jgi:outer membrane immunogenic protein
MRKCVVGSLAAIALAMTGPAQAADMPVKAVATQAPVFSWTGWYVGTNVGYGWGRDSQDPFCITPAGVLGGTGCTILPENNLSPQGWLGGGQFGFNYQAGVWVLGLEADIQAAKIEDSTSLAGTFPTVGGGTAAATLLASQSIDWFGTVRGRVGWTFDRALIYATGGLIYGRVTASQNVVFGPTIQYPSSASATNTGWTAGGGIEYAFHPKWTGRIEGLYYDLGSLTSSFLLPITGFTRGANYEFSGFLVRIGANYRI